MGRIGSRKGHGAYLTVLDPHVSTRGESRRILLPYLGMVGQMERRFILERQRKGIQAAKAKGIYKAGHGGWIERRCSR